MGEADGIKWINKTIDLCPLESVRQQRGRQVQMQSSWFMAFFFSCKIRVLHPFHLSWKAEAQMGGANVWPFVALFLQTVCQCGNLHGWEAGLTPAVWKCLWFLCQEQAEAVLEFVGTLGSKGRSAEDSVTRAWSLWTLQLPSLYPLCLACSQLREMPSHL